MKSIKGIIFFDLGHTLVEGSHPSARRILAQRLGLTEKETHRVGRLIMTHPAREPAVLARAILSLVPRLDQDSIDHILEDVWTEQAGAAAAKPGAVALLKSLRGAGYGLGILSNTWHPFFSGVSTFCSELTESVEHVIVSYELGRKKPDVDLYRMARERAGAEALPCWMVGDTYELDVAPAMAAGFSTVWLLAHPERETPLLARVLRGELPLPHWTAANLDEVGRYFGI